ncbi:MAG: methylthioribose kinase [Paracoccaceae bacterium]|nr:MAG: methylthioribose kinase [Paracoccaceae bacterium]
MAMDAEAAAGQGYAALDPDSLPRRLGGVRAMADRIGPPAEWRVREVGDGNLNLVFIVEGPLGSVVVKQALPYVRLVGDSWPLPLYRSFFEYHALIRQARRDPGSVPEVLHFDEAQALIVMEHVTPHVILRRKLIAGERVAGLGERLGRFCARTAFRGSELAMPSARKKADVALFAGNVEIPAITEALVFTDPYRPAPMNRHTEGLDPLVGRLRGDAELKRRAQRMLMRFASNTETMIHGDLHTGSIMATDDDLRVIDPEFAQYGPMGFDIGMLVANLLMAYFSQPAHRAPDPAPFQEWILGQITAVFDAFEDEFRHLWRTERGGMLYPAALFEDQGQDSMPACEALLREIRTDALTVCGIEMHRRCLSLAHNADFEDIADTALRARLEARNLAMGAELILTAEALPDVTALARSHNERNPI